jgi:hypothetical protein
MLVRTVVLVAGLLAAGAAAAEPMNPDAARRFVVGKSFAYTCFDGTRGTGRISGDGSVAGTIQVRGTGPVRYTMLPPGTLRVKGEAVCASVRGMPFEPCFNLNKTDAQSFRGSVSGLGFAYCDFTRRHTRPGVVRTTWRAHQPSEPQQPQQITATAPPGAD